MAMRASRNPLVLVSARIRTRVRAAALSYQLLLTTLVYRRFIFVPVFLVVCASAFLLMPWLGQDFFPEHR